MTEELTPGFSRISPETGAYEWVAMPDGPFKVIINAADQTVTGAYLNADELAEKAAREAAYEPLRLASLQKAEIEQAIQALAPQLKAQFMSLTEAEQVEFAKDFDVVERRLNNGEVAFAKATISAKIPLTANGAVVKQSLIDGLDSVLALMEG